MSGDVTDDSLLRAIASAPPIQPPVARRPADRPPRPARAWLAVISGLVILIAATVGLGALLRSCCAPVGEPVRDWTLHVDGEPQAVAVRLPNNLFAQLAFREVDYELDAEVPLSAAQRGRALNVTLECFHAPLALAVDGVSIVDEGDTDVAEHRYTISAAATDRASLRLALTARHDFSSSLGFGVAPHLAIGPATRTATAAVNRDITVVALVLAALLAFFYGLLFVLDRRNREYLAALILALSSGVVFLNWLNLAQPIAGRFAPTLQGVSGGALLLSALYFQHRTLHLTAPPRWAIVLWGVGLVVTFAYPLSHALLVVSIVMLAILGPATLFYTLARNIGAAVRGEYRHDARLLLVGYLPIVMNQVFDNTWRVTGVHYLVGLHTLPIGLGLLMLAQTAVLARQFVARQRTIEHTSAELRRLVADRSKQLAEVLGRLAQQPSSPITAGQLIDDRYRVVRTLGAGGMGTVYEVERTADAMRLALKVLRGRGDEAAMARFAREAQIAAELHHPNLVPVLDVGIADRGLFLVMELVAGGSLDRERARFGEPKWARPVLAQIAEGLAAIHAHGIVHRDLKPGNILLAGGVPRIADFGLASLAGPRGAVDALDETTPQSPMLTRAGDVFGTPAFMAPELAAGTKDAAPSSDIFSFGVIAFELLTGRPPFAEPPVIARAHGRPTATVTSDDVDPALRPLVVRCLDLDPAVRPTADELASAFRASAR